MGRGRDEARTGVHDKPGLEARLREDRWRAEVGHDDQRLFSAVERPSDLRGFLCVYNIRRSEDSAVLGDAIASCSQGAHLPFFFCGLAVITHAGYVHLGTHPSIRKTTPRPCRLGDLAESRTQDPKTNATPGPLSARRGLWRPSGNTSTRGGPAVDLVGVLGRSGGWDWRQSVMN